MIALTAIQPVVAFYGAFIGKAADRDGLWWERWALLAAHPIAAVALAAPATQPRPNALFSAAVMELLLCDAAVDARLSGAIAQGYTHGDLEIPLTVAIIPAIGPIFAATQLSRNRPQNRPAAIQYRPTVTYLNPRLPLQPCSPSIPGCPANRSKSLRLPEATQAARQRGP